MFTTFVADTQDKLVQIWKKAGMTWPPTPLGVATHARTVTRPSQPAAPVAAAPRTGRLDPKGTTVFQFFIVDPETACNPMDHNSDSDDNGSTNKPTDMYAWWNANNTQWLESVRNEEITSLWVLVEKVLQRFPPSEKLGSCTEQRATFRAQINSVPYIWIRGSLSGVCKIFPTMTNSRLGWP